MGMFKEYFELNDKLDSIIGEFNNPFGSEVSHNMQFSAKKKEILQMWKNLRPDIPIIIQPMSDDEFAQGEKSSYGEDGIRITGSWPFVIAILSRIKDVITYENPQTKLRLIFRSIEKEKLATNKQSYVFYLNLEKRSRGKSGRPKTKLVQNPFQVGS